jgi:signal transduction histidine kinase
MHFVSRYRGPLVAGQALFIGTWLWAWGQREGALGREQDQLLRQAEGLAKGLAVAVEQLDAVRPENDARFRQEAHAHLQLRRPIRFAIVQRGETVVFQEGNVPPGLAGALRPGLYEAGRLLVVRAGLAGRAQIEPVPGGVPPSGRPPPAPRSPWDWVPAGPPSAAGLGAAPLQLFVGLDAGLTPGALREVAARVAGVLLLAWAAIAALVLAWCRSIHSRDLTAALDAERRERARLAEMSLAAAGLAHETKNPLGLILGLAQRLASNPDVNPGGRATAEQIMDAADRATARLSDFINFAHLPTPNIGDVSAPEVLGRVVAALRPDFDEAGVRLVLTSDDLRIRCDAGMLEQVLVNLLLNSLQASRAGTTTTVRLEYGGASATLSVTDQGRGIAPALLPDIFKPYTTGHPGGHGLGLAIVKRIVEQHGWSIAVRSEVDGGATFALSGIHVVERRERRR